MECLDRIWKATIIRIQYDKKLSACFGNRAIVRHFLVLVRLIDIPNIKIRTCQLPLAHQFSGIVSRPIINNQPLEILHGLVSKAVIHARKRGRAIIGGCKDSELQQSLISFENQIKTTVKRKLITVLSKDIYR